MHLVCVVNLQPLLNTAAPTGFLYWSFHYCGPFRNPVWLQVTTRLFVLGGPDGSRWHRSPLLSPVPLALDPPPCSRVTPHSQWGGPVEAGGSGPSSGSAVGEPGLPAGPLPSVRGKRVANMLATSYLHLALLIQKTLPNMYTVLQKICVMKKIK